MPPLLFVGILVFNWSHMFNCSWFRVVQSYSRITRDQGRVSGTRAVAIGCPYLPIAEALYLSV